MKSQQINDIKFEQVAEGIYSPVGWKNGSAEHPVVAMHPYFSEHFAGYTERFEQFVAEYQGPLITFEWAKKLHGTAERYARLGRTHDTYFLKTGKTSPYPKIGWQKSVDFVKGFNGRPVTMVGGYLRNFEQYDGLGCLGFAVDIFAKNGIEIEIPEDLTFSFE